MKVINLKEYFPMLDKSINLSIYTPPIFLDESLAQPRKSILLFPGGGYSSISPRESEVVALRFMKLGFNVFLLTYNLGPYFFPYPLPEGFAALAYLRQNLEKYQIDPQSLTVMGFSAGGHFAAMLAAQQAKDYFADLLGVSREMLKINGVILAYPVITMHEPTHQGTRNMLLKNQPDLFDFYCVEKQISSHYPPTFIWTTHEDTVVDSQHSLLLAQALKKHGVTFELHYYPFGEHGKSLADENTHPLITLSKKEQIENEYISSWVNHAQKFIETLIK